MNEIPVEADPENVIAPLLPGEDEEHGYDIGPDGPPANTDSSQLPGLRIVVDANSDLELLGVGVAVFAFFYIIPYLVLSALDISYHVLQAIYYPLGTGYILVLHQKMDQKEKFRNHFVVKWADQKDNENKCIGYLVLLLCIYSVDHHTHGAILNWLSELFGRENDYPLLFYPWNIFLLLAIVCFMALSSTSVVFLASRKTYTTFRRVRTMLPGTERTMALAKGGAIPALSVALFALSRQKSKDGEYDGPPYGGFFWGTCEACLMVSSLAALYAAVQFLRAHDWTMPSGATAPAGVRETPE